MLSSCFLLVPAECECFIWSEEEEEEEVLVLGASRCFNQKASVVLEAGSRRQDASSLSDVIGWFGFFVCFG